MDDVLHVMMASSAISYTFPDSSASELTSSATGALENHFVDLEEERPGAGFSRFGVKDVTLLWCTPARRAPKALGAATRRI